MDSLSSDMDRLRLSALSRAATFSPMIREVTIGPNSPRTKRDTFCDTQSLLPPPEGNEGRKQKDYVSREDKIYLENVRRYESEMAEASDASFASMIARMMQKRLEISEKLRRARAEQAKKNEAELRIRIQQMLSAWKYNDPAAIRDIPQDQTDAHDNHGSRTIENMNRIIEEREVVGRMAAIKEAHATISSAYDDIYGMPTDIQDKYIVNLNNIISNMNNILELCEGGIVTEKEVKRAEVLARNIVHLKDKAIEDIKIKEGLLKQQEEEKIRQNKLKEQQEKKDLEKVSDGNTNGTIKPPEFETKQVIRTKPVFYTSTNFEHYQRLKSFMENYEASYKELVNDAAQKKFCFDCRKAVNIPVNSLCSVSGHHIRDKYDKLSKLLKGERVQVMDTYVCVTQHPQGLAYCTALLAKKLVNQGHLTVSSKPEAAFPLASVIIALWCQFPDLAKLIEANFQRECPYLVPMFLPQKEGQSKEDFLKSLGYLYDEDGVVEKQDKFLKRMSGIFRLMCAIWIAKPPRVMTEQNQHGLRHAWRWLASFVNLKPVSQISSTLLFDFFTVCGHDCMKIYGKQFMKVIKLMCTDYMPALDQIDEGGPKSRLEVLLQKILQTGVIPPPSGTLAPNVW